MESVGKDRVVIAGKSSWPNHRKYIKCYECNVVTDSRTLDILSYSFVTALKYDGKKPPKPVIFRLFTIFNQLVNSFFVMTLGTLFESTILRTDFPAQLTGSISFFSRTNGKNHSDIAIPQGRIRYSLKLRAGSTPRPLPRKKEGQTLVRYWASFKSTVSFSLGKNSMLASITPTANYPGKNENGKTLFPEVIR